MWVASLIVLFCSVVVHEILLVHLMGWKRKMIWQYHSTRVYVYVCVVCRAHLACVQKQRLGLFFSSL